MPSRRPYLHRLDEIEGVQVWRVDGHLLRDTVDVEFTNGHHHFTRRYIPEGEIWLDRDAPGAEEWPFWALNQAIQRRRMAEGSSYVMALRSAGQIERAERRRARGIKGACDRKVIRARARRKQLGVAVGREVWLVDGCAVRDLAHLDFTLGGHGYRYRFIPCGEIWIDDAVRPSERAAILHHEAVEVALMARGMPYAVAHARASQAEAHLRRSRRVVLT